MSLFIHLLLCMTKMPSLIKNMNLPVCVNCIHYFEDKVPYFEDMVTYNAKCKKFGVKDIVSGKINYDYASICRSDDLLCGKKGALFEEKPIPIKEESKEKP